MQNMFIIIIKIEFRRDSDFVARHFALQAERSASVGSERTEIKVFTALHRDVRYRNRINRTVLM
jgi:hypothetical protein